MLAKVERFLSNRFPPRSLLLSRNYSPYILPVVIGSTLMALDRWLTDPAVTAFGLWTKRNWFAEKPPRTAQINKTSPAQCRRELRKTPP